jgi:hypothetical protein
VNAEALLIATGQNIKRLLTFSGRGPRKLAHVEALRPPALTPSANSRLLQTAIVGDPHRSSDVFQRAGATGEVNLKLPLRRVYRA